MLSSNISSTDFGIKGLNKYLALVDIKLISFIPEHLSGVGRLLQASGKKLRPSLVIAIAVHSGREVDDTVINAAAAIELVHLASLVHDDIIDNGTLRHGVATINSVEGNDMALLAGNYLFAKGCAIAASINYEAGVLMAETIVELCIGQAMELGDLRNPEKSITSLNAAIGGKTSSLLIAACTLGGLVAHISSQQTKVLTEFAHNFGMAFQYADDVKDFTSLSTATGKSAMSDIQNGNYTLPVILSLQGPYCETLRILLKAQHVLVEEVLAILDKDNSINRAYEEIERYKIQALASLAKIEIPALKNSLETLLIAIQKSKPVFFTAPDWL